MALSLAVIKTAYDDYVSAKQVIIDSLAAIADLGPYPAFPTIVNTDPDYNNVITAEGTYNAAYAPLKVQLDNAVIDTREKEILVIAAIQTGSGVTKGANQWYHLVGTDDPPLDYINWIGYSAKDVAADEYHFLVIRTSIPPVNFFDTNS